MDMPSNDTLLEIERKLVSSSSYDKDEDKLYIAAQFAFRSMLRPKGARKSYYQRHFDEAIEDLHHDNPQVSRALLARFALSEIVTSQKFPVAEASERHQAERLLKSEFIEL